MTIIKRFLMLVFVVVSALVIGSYALIGWGLKSAYNSLTALFSTKARAMS